MPVFFPFNPHMCKWTMKYSHPIQELVKRDFLPEGDLVPHVLDESNMNTKSPLPGTYFSIWERYLTKKESEGTKQHNREYFHGLMLQK